MNRLNVPIFLRKRFSSVTGLAWQYLYPEDKRRRILQKYRDRIKRKEAYSAMKEEVDELAKLLFLFGMYKFFTEGTQAAIKAVDVFKEIDIPGFSVGGDIFEERNKNVMRGETLAKGMLDAVGDEPTVVMILELEHMHQVAAKFKKIKNGQ